jgi:hypothetical protein
VQKYDGSLTCRSYRNHAGCLTCFRVFLPVSGASSVTPVEAQKVDPDTAHSNHRAWQNA